MKNLIGLFIGSLLFSLYTYTAPARPKISTDLMNSILQLTLKSLDLKIENEIFQEALYEIYMLLNDSNFKSQDKDALLQRIKLILALLIEGEQFDDQNWDSAAIASPAKYR